MRQDARTPAAIRSSALRVMPTEPGQQPGANATAGAAAAAAKGMIESATLPAHATESAAWEALGLNSAAVLVLTDAPRAFCSFDKAADNAAFDTLMKRVRVPCVPLAHAQPEMLPIRSSRRARAPSDGRTLSAAALAAPASLAVSILAQQALQASWCCAQSGSVPFDIPPPLASSSVDSGGCTPGEAPSVLPGVSLALELQEASLGSNLGPRLPNLAWRRKPSAALQTS